MVFCRVDTSGLHVVAAAQPHRVRPPVDHSLVVRFLVASPTMRDLLLCAKHLSSEANRTGGCARTRDAQLGRDPRPGPGETISGWARSCEDAARLGRLHSRQRDWDKPRGSGRFKLGHPRCRFQPQHEESPPAWPCSMVALALCRLRCACGPHGRELSIRREASYGLQSPSPYSANPRSTG